VMAMADVGTEHLNFRKKEKKKNFFEKKLI
jgi:hypothetical protein